MRDPVFGLIGIWSYSLGDVLGFRIMGVGSAAYVDMDMSSHRLAHHVAQHRPTFVVRGKFTPL
jgi:hypothetical protein